MQLPNDGLVGTKTDKPGLEDALLRAGFFALGGFAPDDDEGITDPVTAESPAYVLLVGSTGPTLWPALTKAPEFTDGVADPMDRYTRRVLGDIAQAADACAVFPFEGPPYYPFQQWALRCGGFSKSPIGVLVHEDFGPWTGFRAAYFFSDLRFASASVAGAGPCDACADQPCLSACPVSAFSTAAGYDVPRCRTHLRANQDADCWSGCLARRACPQGQNHAPVPENADFHMKSFLGLSQ